MKRIIFTAGILTVMLSFTIGSATARKYKHRGDDALLGVETQSVDKRLAEAFELAVDYGAVINEVVRETPAAEVGLEKDDVIVKLNGRKVWDSRDLSDLIDDYREGDEVVVTVMRGDRELEFTLTLAAERDLYRVIDTPRAPRAPDPPQAFWFDWRRPYLGVSLMDLTRQLGEYFGVEKARGVLVTEVERDSPAEEAGFQAGDIIIRIDGDRIFDHHDVHDIISEFDDGDRLTVVVMRNKSEREIEVTLRERERGRDNRWGVLSLPHLKGLADDHNLWHGSFNGDDWSGFQFRFDPDDMEEFNEEMKELQEELEELRFELHKELRDLNRRVR